MAGRVTARVGVGADGNPVVFSTDEFTREAIVRSVQDRSRVDYYDIPEVSEQDFRKLLNDVTPQDTLAALRLALEELDTQFAEKQDAKRGAEAEMRVRVAAWDADMSRMREVRANLVEQIKVVSQRVRGITPRREPPPPTDCFNPEPEKP
jgi:hypothetical protein